MKHVSSRTYGACECKAYSDETADRAECKQRQRTEHKRESEKQRTS